MKDDIILIKNASKFISGKIKSKMRDNREDFKERRKKFKEQEKEGWLVK